MGTIRIAGRLSWKNSYDRPKGLSLVLLESGIDAIR
jgi:hypothetical protein